MAKKLPVYFIVIQTTHIKIFNSYIFNLYIFLTISILKLVFKESKLQSYILSKKNQKTRHIKKLTISKKSTILVLFSWNFVKIITSRGDCFPQVSWGWDKKCRFCINGQFLNVSRFFSSDFSCDTFSILYTSFLVILITYLFPYLYKEDR